MLHWSPRQFLEATNAEVNAGRKGFYAEEQATLEREASWMAMLLTAQVGEVVTPAQLLGTEEEEKADRVAEAQTSLKKLERKMRDAGLSR